MATNKQLEFLDIAAGHDCGLKLEAAAAGDTGQPQNRRFSMLGYSGGPMRVSGWSSPVVVDLKGMAISRQNKPVFYGHMQDMDSLIGQTDAVKVIDGQLIASGDVIGNSERVNQVMALADKGFKWQASIGARVEESEVLGEGQKAKVNGQDISGPATIVRKSVLGEISFVILGADDNTSAQIAANKTVVKETVMPEETPKVEAKQEDIAAQIRAAAAAESKRIADIRKLCAGKHEEIEAKAIAEGWDVNKAELEVLRASRPTAPAVHTEKRLDNGIILAAACLSAGVSEKTIIASYGQQAIDEAHKHRGIGIQELFRLIARAEGRDLPPMSGTGTEFIRAAFSTVSLPNILSNLANKILLEAYTSLEDSWRNIVRTTTVQDFKLHSRYRLTDNMTFQKVGPDGELKHGQVGEQVYTVQAATSGIMFSLDRQTIINDDLNAFAEIPQFLGIGAAEAISMAVWTLLLSNPNNFFAAGNNNYSSGATTALSYDSLQAAELLFLNQTKPSGKPLAIQPRFLVVPNALKRNALRLMQSALLMESASGKSNVPTTNTMAGAFEVVSSAYLSNTGITGNSTTAWYLFADPARLAAMELAFLNGVQVPTVEQAMADFNTLGVQFRGYIDFGVAMQDTRAAVKMAGA